MIVAFFSGGRDSAVASHIAYTYSKKVKEEFKLVHVDTKIGIPETKEYIRKYAAWLGVDLKVLQPKLDYWESVKKWGYPSIVGGMRWCFHHLKQDPIIEFMQEEFKKGVLYPIYCLGIRRGESRFRLETYNKKWYFTKSHKIHYKVWLPILYWNDKLLEFYMKKYNIPQNPVWQKLGWSGECLCMAGTSLRTLNKIIDIYPHIAKVMYEKDKEVQEVWKRDKKVECYPWPLLQLKIPLHKYIEERKKQRQLTQYLDDTGKNMCMDCLATTLISFLDNDEK